LPSAHIRQANPDDSRKHVIRPLSNCVRDGARIPPTRHETLVRNSVYERLARKFVYSLDATQGRSGHHVQPRRLLRPTALLAATLCFATVGTASEQIPRYGAPPCEADWINRSHFDVVGSLGELRYWEQAAERGDVGFQLRLGLLRKSSDGKWVAPEDHSYNIRWLEKAQAQGSKSAAWELATIQRRQMTHEAYLRSMMRAAEDEGNPWAATRLMTMTNGRWGVKYKPTRCEHLLEIDGKCAPDELLPISSARKWARIAAEGGNAEAQLWLCWSASDGNAEHGQAKDDNAALKWCQIAVHNACNLASIPRYLGAVKRVLGNAASESESERWGRWENQPWRSSSKQFFAN
jgi:hypothetical protein